MHVPPSAPMALLHVYEAAEPHHSTQPSHKLVPLHLLCLLRIEPSLPPRAAATCRSRMAGLCRQQEPPQWALPTPYRGTQLGAATESHPRIAPPDRGRDLSRVLSVRPQALHRGPRPHPLKAQRALRARGPQRAPAPVTPPSVRLSNRHLPSSPRIRTCNPFGQWRPEKKPLIVTVSTSVSHAHHLPPSAATHPPEPPARRGKEAFLATPSSPRGQNFNPCCVCLATVQRGRLNSRNDKSTSNCPDNTKPCPAW